MKNIPSLHFITQKLPNESIVQQAYRMCENGIPLIQYRRKEALTFEEKTKEILEIKKICQQFKVRLIVNDDVQLTLATNADGVHLGKTDMPPKEARKLLGNKTIIGRTANTFEEVAQYQKEADYIGLGPYQWTNTKKKLSPILYYQGMKKILDACLENKINIPIIAVGGVNTEHISELKNIGVHGVAMFSKLYNEKDKKQVIESIKQTFLNNC